MIRVSWYVLFVLANFAALTLVLGGCRPIVGAKSSESVAHPADAVPAPGAPGLGDPLFPELGNGGYDVQHYTVAIDVAMPTNRITATTTISAQATQLLSAFNLDFHGLTLDTVTVNGAPAEHARLGDELTITPTVTVADGAWFTTAVNYHGVPAPLSDPATDFTELGWQRLDDVVYVMNEPAGAMNWHPSNNHPADKATYTLQVTVAEPNVVAANGVLAATIDNGATRTYVWEMAQPMAPYLATLAIGNFELVEQAGPDGVQLRYFFPPDQVERLTRAFGKVPSMMKYYADLLGPYPFTTYGAVVLPGSLGYAMENQTLNLFGEDTVVEYIIAHELMHEWFGNNLTLATWQDIWLNEGFAYYFPFLWQEHEYGIDPEPIMTSTWRLLRRRETFGSATVPAEAMFGASVYQRGGLVLHALRKTVGDEIFFEVIRSYYQRFAGGNAGTADFIAVANEVSGQDLTAFFDSWLYQDEMPALPE